MTGKLFEGYEAANVLWNRALDSANDILNLLNAAREGLRAILSDSSVPESVSQDVLARVAKLDEAEQKLTAALLTVRIQLFHLYPPQPENAIESTDTEKVSPSVLVN